MIPIDKSIPVPKKRNCTKSYPFVEMEVGDSFLVACKQEEKRQFLATVSVATRVYRNRNKGENRKFTVRTTEDGIRCWRIE